MQDLATGNRGQTLIPFAVLIGGVLAFMGLIFDGGRLYYEKARMQAAADAGALAGSWEQQRRNTANVEAAAKQSTKLNGFEHGVGGVDVQVTPSAGNTTVTVVVEQDFPTSFLRVLGLTQSLVRARAVAGLRTYGDACVLALDRSASGAIETNGGPTLVATCGVMSNSAHSTRGLRATGAGTVSATWVGVSGGVDGEEHFTPPPQEGVPTMLDPLAHLAPPDYSTWPAGSYDSASQTYTCPGGTCVYTDTIQITSGSVTFEPGIYVLHEGMMITGGDVSGTEVSFYNINATGLDHIHIAGNGIVTLSAPTSGPMTGILFFADRNSPDMPPGNMIGRGNSSSSFQGLLYFPSQHLDWAGNSQFVSAWTMVVSNTLDISGTADVQQIGLPPDPALLPSVTRPMLVE